jgi:hypothetical protein
MTQEGPKLYEEIVRNVKFTEVQSAMLAHHRRQQWAMLQRQQEITNETQASTNEVHKSFRRMASLVFLLGLVQIVLLVVSSMVLQLRVDRIEKTLPQLQQAPQALTTEEHLSFV